MTGSVTGVACS